MKPIAPVSEAPSMPAVVVESVATPSPSARKEGGWGGLIGIILIVFVIIVAAFYSWGERLALQESGYTPVEGAE